jgi:hypothetical protein
MAGVANSLRGRKSVSTTIFYTITKDYTMLANLKSGRHE